MTIELISANSTQDVLFDAIIIISDGINSLTNLNSRFPELHSAVENFSKVFPSLDNGSVTLIPADKLPSRRIVYSSTGPVHGDFDDVRRYTKAGIAAGEQVIKTGIRCPLLITLPSGRFSNAQFVAALGVLHAFYTPFINRQEDEYVKKVDLLGILELEESLKSNYNGGLVKLLQAVQSSFDVCRDIGEGDPQRMCPSGVADYVVNCFENSSIKVRVEDDPEFIEREYPLMAAVTRCANAIENHKARIIWLEYDGGADPTETLFIVGKGVTLDTGGLDLKVGGSMWGMCKDKYGSAVLAGFFKALDMFRPPGIRVSGCMCMCRNSIGSNAYSCDEIIKARSGKKVHIYNTDAEGRLAMADPLTKFREQALKAKNPHLMTISTLTGHVVISYGHCAAIIDNGPAKSVSYAQNLQATGEGFGQLLEISKLIYEDFDFHSAECDKCDLRQGNTKPSVQTPRGHQAPGAFLMRVSRLDENGLDSSHPLKYTHLDIGLSMEVFGLYPRTTFPAPLLALIGHHILPKAKFQS